MQKIVCILFLTIISITQFTFAQDVRRDRFIVNYSKQIKSASNDKDAVKFVDNELKALLLDGNQFSEEIYLKMLRNIDLLTENRHKIYPDTYNYVLSVYSFVKNNKTGEEFEQWHGLVDENMKNRNPRRIKDFLQESGDFFYHDIVARNPNFIWYSMGGNYTYYLKKNSPYIDFEDVRIVCRTINRGRDRNTYPFSDSIVIENTSGTLDLSGNRWVGQGGKFTWEKVNLPAEETYATLKNYDISLRSTNLTADSVTLHTPYLAETVLGKLIDRAMKGSVKEELPYPHFSSYNADFSIKNIVEDIDYQGGFSLEGSNFIGIGNQNQQAKLTYYRRGNEFITSYSDRVIINNEKLQTSMAKFKMSIGLEDSITHSGLNILYDRTRNTVQFIRGNSALTQSPFVDSYHQLDLYVDQINWDRSTSDLILSFNDRESDQNRRARFESFNYFDGGQYQRLQGMEAINPLNTLYDYAYKYDKFDMTEGEAATALRRTLEQAKSKLIELATLGFITYDLENGAITVLNKTEHFVKARSNRVDYDNISFTSDLTPIRVDAQEGGSRNDRELAEKVRKRNQERSQIKAYGKIDLSTLDMTINAVDYIGISELKRTTLFPDNNEVVVKKNRNFVFKGWVNSGKWEVKIDRGNYSYEDNKFNIFESDIALFKVNPLREEDGERSIPLQSAISGIKGELIVDDVENRSGAKEDFDHYPILKSKEKTKVFYDYRSLHLGAYEKDRFHFIVEPFEIDSLVTFDDKSIRFSGELVSAGIFPVIKEELKIMPDYSLGFSREAPKEGYPFYDTEATYENKIILTNNGLQGAGTIDFLESTSTSKRLFTFLPDSTIGLATFVNHPKEIGVEFPDAKGEDVIVNFLPRQKTLRIRSNNEPILLYEEDAKLIGTAVLRESGMNGFGIFDLPGAQMISDNFQFNRWQTLTDTSNFNLKNTYKDEADLEEDPLAFKSDNVNGNIDFKERKGVFNSNDGTSTVEFPVNKYICKIDQFTWLMDNDELELESKESEDVMSIEGDMDLVGPNFFSIHPRQDSLQFKSPKAKYDLKAKTIYAYDTEFIEVADARIYPDSSKVVIRRNARIEPFENAEIVANFITKYHKVENVKAEITARRAYTATGDYIYGREEDEKQLIHLTEIKLDTSFQTTAIGSIAPEENFMLSEQFNFYGKIQLKAANPRLTFDGATKVNHDCDKFEKNWMAFKTEIDPENIQIPVSDDMRDLEGNKMSVGILWRNSANPDSISLYPTFLSSVDNDDDPIVISASGFLQYNEAGEEFQISSKEKLVNRSETGNFIALHTPTCSMLGEGKISLGMDFGRLETEAVGVINYDQAKDQTDMNITLAIRAPLHERTFRNIGEKIAKVEGISDAEFNSNTLERAIHEWVDLETADKVKSDYTLKKEMRNVPRAMRDAIVITGLRLTSHTVTGDQQRGLKTSSTHATIVNIFSEVVMKQVPVKFFAEQRTNLGDKFGLLLDIPGAYSYYFDYDFRRDGVMNILSTDGEFNEEITNLKPNEKRSNRFVYDITEDSAYRSRFLRVFE